MRDDHAKHLDLHVRELRGMRVIEYAPPPRSGWFRRLLEHFGLVRRQMSYGEYMDRLRAHLDAQSGVNSAMRGDPETGDE